MSKFPGSNPGFRHFFIIIYLIIVHKYNIHKSFKQNFINACKYSKIIKRKGIKTEENKKKHWLQAFYCLEC